MLGIIPAWRTMSVLPEKAQIGNGMGRSRYTSTGKDVVEEGQLWNGTELKKGIRGELTHSQKI